jgi:SAM-dependent methyltransferase
LAEFTGERLVPGQVDVDLLNEHMARYMFAARLSRGKRVLDAGCGAGYGSAELAQCAHSVAGVDVAAEAVEFAREHYQSPNLEFTQGSCTALPYGDGSFDLVVAFEVIEHLEDWREFLREARRVMAPGGQFIVSTPNKLYYTESRGEQGANPFHVHEFEFQEFRDELRAVFPHVSLFLENHVEGVTFQPFESGHTVEVRVDAGEPAPDESHFFVAVCAHRPQLGNPTFVYIPRAGNVLRERERHIAKLEQELEQKHAWWQKAQEELAEFDRQHQQLLDLFRNQKDELDRSNLWAAEQNVTIAALRAQVVDLEEQLAHLTPKLVELENDVRVRTQWALDLETRLKAEVDQQTAELVRAVEALHHTEKELHDRTAWALQLQEETRRLEEQVTLFRSSRWVKLGRKVGLGPVVPTS